MYVKKATLPLDAKNQLLVNELKKMFDIKTESKAILKAIEYTAENKKLDELSRQLIDLEKLNIKYMLGHSLGEYSALTAANIISIKDSAKLLK